MDVTFACVSFTVVLCASVWTLVRVVTVDML